MRQGTLLFVFALLFGLAGSATAQVNVNINAGPSQYRQPIYNEVADYYYLPDYGVYYNVNRKMYFYPERGRWVYARRLPARYGYRENWRRTHFVRIHERAPFLRHDHYYRKYGHGKGKYKAPKQHGQRRYDDRNKHYDQRRRPDARYERGHNRPHGQEHKQHPGRGHDRGHR